MAFYPIANLVDLYDGLVLPCKIAGKPLLLLHDQGQTLVIEDRCPHMDAPLHTGAIKEGAIVCRAHGIAFDLDSGKARGPLANTLSCLKTYSVAYDGSKVGVEL